MKFAKIFDNANLYRLFQFSVMRPDTLNIIRNEVLKPESVYKVLDFGCGIGYHSIEFPKSNYLGIEPLESCVRKANAMFSGDNRTFVLGDHRELRKIPDSSYDLIIAIGVLHHVDDVVMGEFLTESYRILRDGGRLTTLDPVIHNSQSKISKWVVKRDRGHYVRDEGEYKLPVNSIFRIEPTVKIYNNLLRIPYDHISMTVFKNELTISEHAHENPSL
jgi:ubiquinone/menaquinone biosynthesis C-methylase UbiE